MDATAPILLVEDNANDVLLIRRSLGKVGVTAPLVVLSDGEQAQQYLSGDGDYADRHRHPLPRIVLLDLKLPRRGGKEVLEWLRTRPGLRRLPVVVLTSSVERSDIQHCYELGANSYLVKPVQLEELASMMKLVAGYWLEHNQGPDLSP